MPADPSPFARIDPQTMFSPGVVAPPDLTGEALWFLYQGERLLVAQAADSLLPVLAATSPEGIELVRRQYLGCWGEGADALPCFSGEIAADAAAPTGFTAVDLRSLFGVWEDRWIDLVGRAKQIVQWDRDHQFCGRCATLTESAAGERARRCPRCGLTSYPRISPAIIIAVTRSTEAGEQILLARNHRFPVGRYSVIAGFVEAGETLEECALREVREEVGVRVKNIRYFGSQPWPFPNSLMIGFTAEYADGEINLEESEIADARWFSPADMPQLPPRISIARRLIESFLSRQAQQPTDLQDW